MNAELIQIEPPSVEPTDCIRGTRSGTYYGKLGYLAGLGRSSVVIAESMGDGIHPAYVRTILKRWGVPRNRIFCQVPVFNLDRCLIQYRAQQAGLEQEEWLQRIIREVAHRNLYRLVMGEAA